MKRRELIKNLIGEGFTPKTLSLMTDKELQIVSKMVLKEAVQKTMTVMDKENPQDVASLQAMISEPDKHATKLKNTTIAEKDEEESKEDSEVEEWVVDLAESKYTPFTTKREVLKIISEKLKMADEPEIEFGEGVKKGHNGIPEFMTYDSISNDTQTQPAPTKDPVQPEVHPDAPPKRKRPARKTPYKPGPGTNPKPKALGEDK